MTEATPTPDGISSAQGARLEERISNIGVLLKEVRDDQKKTNESIGTVIGVQRDVLHLATKQAETEVITEQNSKSIEAIGKHVAVVSLWGKIAHGLVVVVLGAMGWGMVTVVNAIRSFDDVGRRLTSLETIVNAKALESTFDPPVSPDTPQSPPSGGRRR